MIESNDLKIILLWPLLRFWSRSATDSDLIFLSCTSCLLSSFFQVQVLVRCLLPGTPLI